MLQPACLPKFLPALRRQWYLKVLDFSQYLWGLLPYYLLVLGRTGIFWTLGILEDRHLQVY